MKRDIIRKYNHVRACPVESTKRAITIMLFLSIRALDFTKVAQNKLLRDLSPAN